MAVADQNVTFDLQMGFGLQDNPANLAVNYTEPTTTTAKFLNQHVETVDPNTLNHVVDIDSIFSGIADPIAFSMQDLVESPGVPVRWGLAVGGPRFRMAGTGVVLMRVDGVLPILYIDNLSLTNSAILQFSVMGD